MHAVGTQDSSVGNSEIEARGGSDRARVSLGNLFVAKKGADKCLQVNVYTRRPIGLDRPDRHMLTGLILMSEDEARRLALQLLLALESAEVVPLESDPKSEKTIVLPDTNWAYRQ